LTADVNEQTKRRALSAGATDFLVKPFDHLEVLLRIANSLETRRLHLLLDNQRAAFEEAVRARSLELREARSNWADPAE
jgi:DNA-binding response OmpR family regulator